MVIGDVPGGSGALQSLPTLLRELRLRRGFSQRELADLVHRSADYVSLIERGRLVPSAGRALALDGVLHAGGQFAEAAGGTFLQHVEPLPMDGRPLAVQVAQRLGEALDAGRLPPGAVLPPDLDMARYLRVSAKTIEQARKLVGGAAGTEPP